MNPNKVVGSRDAAAIFVYEANETLVVRSGSRAVATRQSLDQPDEPFCLDAAERAAVKQDISEQTDSRFTATALGRNPAAQHRRADTCPMSIETQAGGPREDGEILQRGWNSGGEPSVAQQAEIKASPAAKMRAAEETEGGASPLKLYLGQILLGAANLSSTAHTNHSHGGRRRCTCHPHAADHGLPGASSPL